MPNVGRWTSVDPLADQYPAYSPYNYVLNNPLSNVDPDGREVRCRTEVGCQTAADELNAVHEGQTGIAVVETQWQESRAVWWKPLTWGKTEAISGFKLSTGDSEFDWSQDQYTAALYDVINSEEIVFNLHLVPGNTDLTGHPLYATAFDIQGTNRSYPGGGNVFVSRDGNRLGEPMGVVLMHELVGHGHRAGGGDALDVNRHYQRRLGYGLAAPRASSHGGYHSRIGWKRWNLYRRNK